MDGVHIIRKRSDRFDVRHSFFRKHSCIKKYFQRVKLPARTLSASRYEQEKFTFRLSGEHHINCQRATSCSRWSPFCCYLISKHRSGLSSAPHLLFAAHVTDVVTVAQSGSYFSKQEPLFRVFIQN